MLQHFRPAAWLASVLLLATITGAAAQSPPPEKQAFAIFAGGCFWCVEEAFEKVPGVVRAVSGYTGGKTSSPTYEEVMTKTTGHAEAVQVAYDPSKVTYAQLVDWFWRNIDPVDAKGQFCDKGDPYRSAIFYLNDEQKKVAEESKRALQASGRFKAPIATEITAAAAFYPAEGYHQDYYKTNSFKYQYYKNGCGRPQRLEQIWGPPKPPITQ